MADALLTQILSAVTQLQQDNKLLAASVDAINGRVNALADVKRLKDDAAAIKEGDGKEKPVTTITTTTATEGAGTEATEPPSSPTNEVIPTAARKPNVTSRIILTTYPGQSGIDPIIMNWGEKDTAKRGPVVVSRGASTVRRRNGEFFTVLLPIDCRFIPMLPINWYYYMRDFSQEVLKLFILLYDLGPPFPSFDPYLLIYLPLLQPNIPAFVHANLFHIMCYPRTNHLTFCLNSNWCPWRFL